jgi:hypothetical protein
MKLVVYFLICALSIETGVTAQERTQEGFPTFVVKLPRNVGPLPEPLSTEQKQPGFRLRGIKGWMWTPQQYLDEIPVLASCKMNFLMNCYTSMSDIEHHTWGDTACNRWWEPLPDAKKRAYEEVVRSCAEHGVQFCFSMNPNLSSKRYPSPDSPADLDSLWQHYRWMQGLGVKWFNISLDDINQGIDAKKQARLVNEIYRRLRAVDAAAQMIFCPTFYWGNGTDPDAHAYLKQLATELAADVLVFWTGDQVVTPRITRRAAESYRNTVGHRLILWDNYPVNDHWPTMHLGPVTGRDADLCEVIDGYMSNPLSPQNEINRIPMLTCADYAYNPGSYDPMRSIGQAIVHLARTRSQQEVLKEVVEAYPGMLLYNKGTGFNPVREKAVELAKQPDGKSRQETYVAGVAQLLENFNLAFPDQFRDCARTIADDLAWLQENLRH